MPLFSSCKTSAQGGGLEGGKGVGWRMRGGWGEYFWAILGSEIVTWRSPAEEKLFLLYHQYILEMYYCKQTNII